MITFDRKNLKCTTHKVWGCNCLLGNNAVAMDSASSIIAPAATVATPSRAGKTKLQYATEVQNFMRHGSPDEQEDFINKLLGEKFGLKSTAFDSSPCFRNPGGLSPREIVQLAVDLARKPAKRRAATAANDSLSDSAADLNALYSRLHRTNRKSK